MWYVIQTQSGKEKTVKEKIEKRVNPDCYESVKIIYYECKRKYQGAWHVEEKTMFPGYLFIVTDKIDDVYTELKKIPEMTKLLGYDGEVIPITKQEEELLKRLCRDKNTVEMSYGIQVGDKIIVKDGVLQGMEPIIRKVDRHKRKAYIEVNILGEVRQVEIGLEIVEKRPAFHSDAEAQQPKTSE